MAGDGTTTATVLAREVLRESQRYRLVPLRGAEAWYGHWGNEAIVETLKGMANDISSVEQISNIATVQPTMMPRLESLRWL